MSHKTHFETPYTSFPGHFFRHLVGSIYRNLTFTLAVHNLGSAVPVDIESFALNKGFPNGKLLGD